ncbi:MAG TPA: isoprenylcysteine carboxylmethyltransferase family protein [Anaerolineae bacterium]|nr:isoprenylcysteine carboxylmethyltransferase family protein [Anaerolineae bacterium]
MRKRLHLVAFPLAGITLIASWLIFFLFPPVDFHRVLFILGNVCVAFGVLLIVLAISTLRSRGDSSQGAEFTATSRVVRTGIYSIVRHPLYLGWLFMYPAVMILSLHWLVWVLGFIGMGCMVLIVIEGETQLLEKFGSDYRAYMQEVPRFNLLLGLWRNMRS